MGLSPPAIRAMSFYDFAAMREGFRRFHATSEDAEVLGQADEAVLSDFIDQPPSWH